MQRARIVGELFKMLEMAADDEMKLKLAECNEWVMRFFDMVNATPEDEEP